MDGRHIRTSDMLSASSTRRDIDRLDRTKADDKATDIRFNELEKDVDEAKKIALGARKQAYIEHPCHQEVRMTSVEKKATSWDKWFKGVLVTVISAIVVLGSFMATVWYTKADASEVAKVKQHVTAIKGDVNDIQKSQERIEAALAPEEQMALEEARMELIKQAMKEAVQEVKADIKPERPSRGGRRPH